MHEATKLDKAVRTPLIRKGSKLLACLIAIEIAFFAILLEMLKQAEHDIVREAHAREVINRTNLLIKSFYEAGAALFVYSSSRNLAVSDDYNQAVDRAVDQLRILETLVAGEETGTKSLRELRMLSEEALRLLDQSRRGIESGSYASEPSKVRLEIALLQRRILPQMEKFTETQTVLTGELTRAKSISRQGLLSCLVVGFVINVLMGVIAISFFFRHITRRLDVLVDNTVRLADERTLHEPIKGDDEISHLDGVFRRTATALRAATQKERAIVSNSVDVICMLSDEYRFTYVSPSVTRQWGFEVDDVMTRAVEDIVAPDGVVGFKSQLQQVLEKNRDLAFETVIVDAEKKRIETLWAATWSDETKSFFCVVHNISERKALERAKQQFIAMVVHDLRTPLTALIGTFSNMSLGIYGDLNERGSVTVANAQKTVGRLINLINDILDAEKLQAGTFELYPEHVPLAPIVRSAVMAVKSLAESSNINIDHEYFDVEIYFDEERLEQILINLLSNAMKFSPAGTSVKVTAVAKMDFVEISVLDQGVGIALQHQTGIFEPFRQVSKHERNKEQGVGLGLPICRRLVELGGGTIGVDSEIGKGARFWVRIPKGTCVDDNESE